MEERQGWRGRMGLEGGGEGVEYFAGFNSNHSHFLARQNTAQQA